jgi:hypothetical protein
LTFNRPRFTAKRIRDWEEPATRETYYQAQYADWWMPEVSFLVKSAIRAARVNQMLERWRAKCRDRVGAEPIVARCSTFADAERELREVLGLGRCEARDVSAIY